VFSVHARDTEGRQSVTSQFTAPAFAGQTTTVANIFLAPTISLSANEIIQRQPLAVSGQSFPGATVQIFILPENRMETAAVSANGKWTHTLATNELSLEGYSIRARAVLSDGRLSPFSQTLSFLLTERVCANGDLSGTGRVTMVDVSILLYWWGTSNACADLNGDGVVNMSDLSILLYYWTG
jgi:hypothetical protein